MSETEAARLSDEVTSLKPGTDAALALAMMHVIVGEGRHDGVRRAPDGGIRRLEALEREFTPEWAATITGVAVDRIGALARG